MLNGTHTINIITTIVIIIILIAFCFNLAANGVQNGKEVWASV